MCIGKSWATPVKCSVITALIFRHKTLYSRYLGIFWVYLYCSICSKAILVHYIPQGCNSSVLHGIIFTLMPLDAFWHWGCINNSDLMSPHVQKRYFKWVALALSVTIIFHWMTRHGIKAMQVRITGSVSQRYSTSCYLHLFMHIHSVITLLGSHVHQLVNANI